MSFAGTFTSTPQEGVSGSSVIDFQIAFALVRHAVKQVDSSVRVYLDHEIPSEPEDGVLAQLVSIEFPVQPEGHLGGADVRQAVFEIAIASSGFEAGERTNDNRMGGYAAEIAAALEGRSFIYTPGADEPADEHVLQVERVSVESLPTPDFRPSGVVVLRAMGTIDRAQGRGMLSVPA